MRETIRETLSKIGLSDKEIEVYVFLGKSGPKRGLEITKHLKMNRGQVYRILKSLEKNGIVESTLEHPKRVIAVPLEKLIDSYIKSKRDEVDQIEQTKDDLLSDWKKIKQIELGSSYEKFSVIEGEGKIFNKISQMIKETKKEFLTISSVYEMLTADKYGIFEEMAEHPLKDKIKFRFLTQLTKDDLKKTKAILKMIGSNGNVKAKDPERGSSVFPRIVIKDRNEMLLFISNDQKKESVLLTNCQSIIESFYGVFQDLWNSSIDIEKRIAELESDKPPSMMELIKDFKSAEKKYFAALDKAKEEILFVTSSKRLVEISKNTDRINKWCKNGVSTKIMAPITNENLKAVQLLLTCSEIRHIPVGYRETTIIDGKNLFQFNNSCPSDVDDCELLNLENVFFTNDLDYIKQTKTNINGIWKNTHTPPVQGIRSIQRETSNDSICINHHPILEKRAYNIDLKHQKIGDYCEKEVLSRIEKERNIASKEKGKQFDTMRYFGQRAFALVYPPKDLEIPKMIIGVFKDDKLSASKGQEYVIFDTLQGSKDSEKYVPVAIIQNTSELLEHRRKSLVDLPARNNIRVIENDKFKVQVKGNTLFAGWTIPIKLTSNYILPPACILFEGYGEIKSGMFTSDTPINRKYEIWYNSLDAFVSFFLPDYKYIGAGTEGYIDINSVWISKAH